MAGIARSAVLVVAFLTHVVTRARADNTLTELNVNRRWGPQSGNTFRGYLFNQGFCSGRTLWSKKTAERTVAEIAVSPAAHDSLSRILVDTLHNRRDASSETQQTYSLTLISSPHARLRWQYTFLAVG